MNQTKNGDIYGEWIYNNGFWINQRTKEESCFHPKSIEIGSFIYKSAKRFIPSKKNRK
jgi:hypothetical protein